MLRIAFILIFVVSAMAGLSSSAEARRVALVIGNSDYVHASALPNPSNDARDIAARFQQLDYEVELVNDASRARLLDALRSFRSRSLGAEHSVIYYAGHGIEIDRQNFVVPVDAVLKADIDVEYEAVPLDLLVAATSGARGLQLVVLDACRDNPFLTRMTRTLASRSVGRGLAVYEPDGNSLVAYAAREGTVALDGTGSNSPYARAFLGALQKPGLEIGQFFRQVRDAVVRETNGQQEPFLYGSLSAEPVYFQPAPPDASAPAAGPSTVGQDSGGPSANTLLAIDISFWESIRNSAEPSDFQDYLDRFPQGQFRPLAQRRLAALDAPANTPRSSVTAEPSAPASSAAAPSLVIAPPQATEQQVEAPAPQSSSPAPVPLQLSRSAARDLQTRLNILGYSAGTADGIIGPRTRSAIEEYRATRAMTGGDRIDAALLDRLKGEVSESRLTAYRNTFQQPAPKPAPKPAPGPNTAAAPKPKPAAKPPEAKAAPKPAPSGNLAAFVGRTYCRSKNGVVLNGRNLSDRPIWCITVLSLNNSQIRYRVSQRPQAGKPISNSVFTRGRSGTRVYGPVRLASSGSGSLVANGATFVASQMFR